MSDFSLQSMADPLAGARLDLRGAPAAFRAALKIAARHWVAGGITFRSAHRPGNRPWAGAEPGPRARVVIHDYNFIRRVMAAGDIGFAEGYMAGEWDTPDLTAVLESASLNWDRVGQLVEGNSLMRVVNFLRHLVRPNTRQGSRKNIHAHYDLGNAFYQCWLDPSMTYSSARYASPDQSLDQAQRHKYATLAQSMDLAPGHRVLEIGCGWGGFALCAELRLHILPVAIDGRGMVPESLANAVRLGAKALITIPRAQNPTGAALDQRRVNALLKELRRAPNLLVIEDDYVAMLTATPLFSLAGNVPRWMHVRSLAKTLGPDLRVAFAAGDILTIERMQQRQALSAGWVSWILQGATAAMLTDSGVEKLVKTALKTYATRRLRFARTLRARGVPIGDGDGLQVWLPVDDELHVVRMLDAEGWAVDSGSRYRFQSAPRGPHRHHHTLR